MLIFMCAYINLPAYYALFNICTIVVVVVEVPKEAMTFKNYTFLSSIVICDYHNLGKLVCSNFWSTFESCCMCLIKRVFLSSPYSPYFLKKFYSRSLFCLASLFSLLYWEGMTLTKLSAIKD